MNEQSLSHRYVRRLEVWPAAMRRYLYVLPGRPGLGCYGPGDHGHWAMQAHNTAAAGFAVLATAPELDADRAGMSRDELLAWALRLLRFSLHSHHAGGGATLDGQPWGHSWISSLGLERMMHGIDALSAHLTDEDRAGLERVLTSECDWLLDCYHRGPNQVPGAITAGLVDHNHPENNIWNGCMLHRTARLFPGTPRHGEYLEKGTGFLLNGISVEADATASGLIAGRALADWHVGANFFPSFALNHHGYLNVGYMVICLSNVAMLHFACRANGWTPPEGLTHHARELWQLVKTCTFPDGRLWRIGGDTRVRYCYCQDYAIPTWLLARDVFGDAEAQAFETGWLSLLELEAAANPDGAFLSARLRPLEAVSPTYYARLEGDRAVALSMGAAWNRLLAEERGAACVDPDALRAPVALLSDWSDTYHGSMLVRGPKRLASWTWRAAEPPQGQCLPPTASSMAEWRGNLAGCVRGFGMAEQSRCEPLQQASFAGGFATCGRVAVRSVGQLAEGASDYEAAVIDLACVALPDDRTMVVLQRARVGCRTWLRTVKGLYLQIPNDLFNGFQRTLATAAGERVLQGCPATTGTQAVEGDWLTLDDALAVLRIYGPPLAIHQPAERRIAIRGKEQGGGQLYADEICCGCAEGMQIAAPGAVLFDLGVAILAGCEAGTARTLMAIAAPRAIACCGGDVRAVTLPGADGKRYVVVANFGAGDAVEALGGLLGEDCRVLAGGSIGRGENGSRQVSVAPGHVGVLCD